MYMLTYKYIEPVPGCILN